MKAAAVKATEPKAAKATSERGARGNNSATLAQAAAKAGAGGWADVAGFALMLSRHAHTLNVPEGRESACKDALAALSDAAEALAPFLRNVKKAAA